MSDRKSLINGLINRKQNSANKTNKKNQQPIILARMKIRPQPRPGIQVSLSKKFYQRSNSQTQSQITQIKHQNQVKKQIIHRMTIELQNLQQFLNQTCLAKSDLQPNLSTNIPKYSMSTITTQKSLNKNPKHNHPMNIKINQIPKIPQSHTLSPKQFARSQSACKNSAKKNSNRNSFASVKRSKCPQQHSISTKQPSGAISHQDLKSSSHKKLSTIRINKNENYVKYLECRLRQLAKEVKRHNDAQLKIQKKTVSQSRRA